MAAVGNDGWPTLVDVAKRLDPDGRLAMIAEVMDKANPILEDMPFIEGNEMSGHRGTIRTGLPAVAWRILNYGVAPGKSTTKQVVDACGILEAYSRIDVEVYKLNGASEAFRMSEDSAQIESMAIEMANVLFYGNQEATPEKFTGLTPRYGVLSGADSAANVVNFHTYNAIATNDDLESMWLLTWGERTMHGIYPKGSKAGLDYQNLGEQTYQNSSDGTMMQVMISHFMQKAGLHLKDWAGNVRICNIDRGELDNDTDRKLLVNAMIDAYYKIPVRLRRYGRKVWYCSPRIKSILDKAAMDKAISQLTIANLADGTPLTRFWGIAIKECDALATAETQVA